MKQYILCPECKEAGRKPKRLARFEDVIGRGDLYLFCKDCRKEVHINVEDISLDR